MAIDFGEKEREFIEGLKENTGRDLAEWMQAITNAQLPHRNDIIDWLRHKGLMFSKASWLERIHHNGGRPIYAGVPSGTAPRRPVRRRNEPRLAPSTLLPPAPPPAAPTEPPGAPLRTAPVPLQATPAPVPAAAPATAPADIDTLLAKAKAYRPLAQLILAKVRQAAPTAPLSLRESALAIGQPMPFALLGISPKEVRLHLALGDHPFDETLKKGQAGGGLGKGEALSHMLVLNDARQVDARLTELIAQAASRTGN